MVSECYKIGTMKNESTIIRLSVTGDVRRALNVAKRRYPTLSEPEILKLGLSKIVTENSLGLSEVDEIRLGAAYAVGKDYLDDSKEDVYSQEVGKRVDF